MGQKSKEISRTRLCFRSTRNDFFRKESNDSAIHTIQLAILQFRQTYCCEDTMVGTQHTLSRFLIKFFQRIGCLSSRLESGVELETLCRGKLAFSSIHLSNCSFLISDAATQPSLVIVYFGGNDSMGPHSSGLGPHVPLPEYIETMRKIALHLKSLSDTARVIFLTCPPVNEAKVRENTSYSEACVELCQEMGVKVVDLWTAIQSQDDWLTACFMDGVHLSAEGSKVVVEEILKVLKEAEWEPCLHWKSMLTEFGEDSPYYLVPYGGRTTINPSEWTFHRGIQWD